MGSPVIVGRMRRRAGRTNAAPPHLQSTTKREVLEPGVGNDFVVRDARAKDVDHGVNFVGQACGDELSKLLLLSEETTGDISGTSGDGKCNRIRRHFSVSARCGFRAVTFGGGR